MKQAEYREAGLDAKGFRQHPLLLALSLVTVQVRLSAFWGVRYMDYAALLKDDRWKQKRATILERDNHTCSVCQKPDKKVEVHHLRYGHNDEPWEADDVDLVCLCSDCHESYHKAVKWVQRELVDIPPKQLLRALHGNGPAMADLIAEIAGRLAALSWNVVNEVPLR